MKKKISLLLCALFMILSLAGCSGNTEATTHDTAEEEQLAQLHKQMSSWMCFAKDDTLLFTYLEACQKRLFELSKPLQKDAAKHVLAVAKNYKLSKEYLSLLYLAKDLYEDDK